MRNRVYRDVTFLRLRNDRDHYESIRVLASLIVWSKRKAVSAEFVPQGRLSHTHPRRWLSEADNLLITYSPYEWGVPTSKSETTIQYGLRAISDFVRTRSSFGWNHGFGSNHGMLTTPNGVIVIMPANALSVTIEDGERVGRLIEGACTIHDDDDCRSDIEIARLCAASRRKRKSRKARP